MTNTYIVLGFVYYETCFPHPNGIVIRLLYSRHQHLDLNG